MISKIRIVNLLEVNDVHLRGVIADFGNHIHEYEVQKNYKNNLDYADSPCYAKYDYLYRSSSLLN